LEGVKKMINGTTTMLAGTLETIESDYSLFSEISICKISRSFKDFYTFMYSRIDQESKNEFDERIATISKSHLIKCIRDNLKAK
jgi:hypothetical protein